MSKGKQNDFYKSAEWKACRESYAKKACYLCERCGEPGEIVHHKTRVKPETIDDPRVLYDFNNLEMLCRQCHGKEHGDEYKERDAHKFDGRRYYIDEQGRVIVKEDCEY